MNLQQLMNLVVTPYMPEALISQVQMARIGEVAAHFPGQLSSFFGFECRLGETEAKGDFLFCTTQSNSERDILSGKHPTEHLPASLFTHDVWQRVDRFAKQWDSQQSPLYHQANKIWFEFDMDDVDVNMPVPSFFFGPQNINSRADVKRVCETALDTLLNGTLDPAIQESLFRCIDRLPDPARIFQIGTMLSRNTPAIRVCINQVRPDQIPGILKDLEWPGDMAELNHLLMHLAIMVDHVCLNIDVAAGLLPKIGLECYINQDESAHSKWMGLLNTLEETDLCTTAKKEALTKYVGGVHRFITNKVWPEYWMERSRLIKNSQLSAFLRTVNHIKITSQPERRLEAKAYLGARHVWVPTRQLVDAQRQVTKATTTAEY